MNENIRGIPAELLNGGGVGALSLHDNPPTVDNNSVKSLKFKSHQSGFGLVEFENIHSVIVFLHFHFVSSFVFT